MSASLRPLPLTGQESNITISFDCSPVPVPPSLISCSLTPPDNSQPIQCSVKESRQSGQYNIVFTSVTRGLHQLHVRVNDIESSSSPMSIPISVPPEKKSSPVKTISGLRRPSGLSVTNDGLVIVSERSADSITVLDKEGKKIRSFGSHGAERGQLKYPEGIAISSKGTILVADKCNHRIQEFTMDGKCLSCVGTAGNSPLQFDSPRGIAVNRTTGQVVVADYNNHRVQVLNFNLTFCHMFGRLGSGRGQFKCPTDIAVDNEGFVYVADRSNHRIQKFTIEGQFVCSFGTEGSQPGQLYYPAGVTVDDNDLVYVSDWNDYISVYMPNGEYKCRIQKHCNKKDNVFVTHGVSCSTSGDLCVCCYCDGNIVYL